MPFANANDLRMYYELHGHGEPLVLIAGIGGDHNVWSAHLPEMCQHFTCLVFDNRGVGDTAGAETEYSSRLMADDTAALMESLGISGAHVVGVSMGGIIAQELAIYHPQKVRKLVLASTWAKMDAHLGKVFGFWVELAQSLGMAATYTDALLWSFTPRYFDDHPDFFQSALQNVPEDPGFIKAFVGQAKACIQHDALGRLDRIHARILILVGDEDILTPLRFASQLQNAIPEAQMTLVKGCPHAFHLEMPQDFTQAVLGFLQGDEK